MAKMGQIFFHAKFEGSFKGLGVQKRLPENLIMFHCHASDNLFLS